MAVGWRSRARTRQGAGRPSRWRQPRAATAEGVGALARSVRGDGTEVVPWHRDARYLLADHALDRAHHRDLVRRHEGERVARREGAPRTADAVHVVFRLLRNVVVDDV